MKITYGRPRKRHRTRRRVVPRRGRFRNRPPRSVRHCETIGNSGRMNPRLRSQTVSHMIRAGRTRRAYCTHGTCDETPLSFQTRAGVRKIDDNRFCGHWVACGFVRKKPNRICRKHRNDTRPITMSMAMSSTREQPPRVKALKPFETVLGSPSSSLRRTSERTVKIYERPLSSKNRIPFFSPGCPPFHPNICFPPIHSISK